MAEHSGAARALVKIKQEPCDDPHAQHAVFARFARARSSAVDIERMVNADTAVRGLIPPALRARMEVDEDEVLNSDEERSRAARASEYAKASQAATKRARRRLNPPDEWKDKVTGERRGNVLLAPMDAARAPVEFIATGDDMETSVEDGLVVVENGRRAVPLVAQPLLTTKPPVLRRAVHERLATQTARAARGAPPIVHPTDGAVACFTESSPEGLLLDLSDTDRRKGIVLPDLFQQAHGTHLDDMLMNGCTNAQGELLAQMFLQTPVCSHADLSFVNRQLMATGLVNCPLSRVGPLDDYYSLMTMVPRSVEEGLMRQPWAFERPCIEGPMCMGWQIPNSTPVTLVEYLTMDDLAHYREKGTWRGPQRHCVFCRRALATKAAYSIIAECAAYSDSMVADVKIPRESPYENERRALMLVDFCHFVGVDGYSPFDVILSNVSRYMGIIAPVAMFVTNRFRQVKRDGILWFEQDYIRPKRNLRDWVTLVCEESSSGTQTPRPTTSAHRPRRAGYFPLPRPPLATSKRD